MISIYEANAINIIIRNNKLLIETTNIIITIIKFISLFTVILLPLLVLVEEKK